MNEAERSHSIEEWLHIVDISNPACQGKCASLPFGDSLNCGGNTDPGGLHFTGKKHDIESGLDYFGARYYDENVGRFTSPDPGWMRAGSTGNPQSWNQYAYVLNNPLALTDPTGLDYKRTGCGKTNTLNCRHNVYGTYDSMGVFSPTVITSSSSSDSDGEDADQQQNTEIAQDEAPESPEEAEQESEQNALEPLKPGENVASSDGRVPGAIYPGKGEKGPLDALGRSSDFEWYIPWTPKEDTVLYRFSGDPAGLTGKGNGTYYSFFPPGPEDFMRDQMSLPSQWNSMEHLDEVPIKAGTLMYIGPASAQGGYSGGGFQAFVPNP